MVFLSKKFWASWEHESWYDKIRECPVTPISSLRWFSHKSLQNQNIFLSTQFDVHRTMHHCTLSPSSACFCVWFYSVQILLCFLFLFCSFCLLVFVFSIKPHICTSKRCLFPRFGNFSHVNLVACSKQKNSSWFYQKRNTYTWSSTTGQSLQTNKHAHDGSHRKLHAVDTWQPHGNNWKVLTCPTESVPEADGKTEPFGHGLSHDHLNAQWHRQRMTQITNDCQLREPHPLHTSSAL